MGFLSFLTGTAGYTAILAAFGLSTQTAREAIRSAARGLQ